MTFNRFEGLGTPHAIRTLVFRSRTAWLRRFQGRERDIRDQSASVCLGGAGRQCIEAVLPLATDDVRVVNSRRDNPQGANTEATALARLLAPLVDGMTTTRHQLLTWVQSAGLVALDAVFREEAAALAGPKGRQVAPAGDEPRSEEHTSEL